jgi:3-deoxy-7-phosphoheptulonate synthase
MTINPPKIHPVLIDGVTVGRPGDLVLMAGPCAIESRDQIERIARLLNGNRIPILRGGAFKPRTSPYSFQGLGEDGLKIIRSIADEFGLRVVTEVMDTAQLDAALRYAHMIQVGARSMTNSCLLKALGDQQTPVLLKRGFSSTLDEFLLAAEHILKGGNPNILLCERGIRTFENATRFTLDISAVPVLKKRCGRPVVVDPSHAAGDSALVPRLAMAAVAAGADALLLEVHPQPERALCDSKQALTFDELETLLPRLERIKKACQQDVVEKGRTMASGNQAAQNHLL